eukprot:1139334-Pelagomonas_calceolata.AAC.8
MVLQQQVCLSSMVDDGAAAGAFAAPLHAHELGAHEHPAACALQMSVGVCSDGVSGWFLRLAQRVCVWGHAGMDTRNAKGLPFQMPLCIVRRMYRLLGTGCNPGTALTAAGSFLRSPGPSYDPDLQGTPAGFICAPGPSYSSGLQGAPAA